MYLNGINKHNKLNLLKNIDKIIQEKNRWNFILILTALYVSISSLDSLHSIAKLGPMLIGHLRQNKYKHVLKLNITDFYKNMNILNNPHLNFCLSSNFEAHN